MSRNPKTSKSKTEMIVSLLAQGVPVREIMHHAECSQGLVYKTLKSHESEIAQARIPGPEKSKAPSIRLPKLDPAQPIAPQLEQMAWKVIASAAAGEDVTVKQANAAREIIKQALRDRVPPPQDRHLTFRIDILDLQDGQEKPSVVETKRYDVRPY